MAKTKRKRRSTTDIRKILQELQESGVSQREFAFKHGIPLSTLCNWLGKHRRAIRTPELPTVIPVGTLPEPQSELVIEFPGGEVLRIGAGCRGEDLRCVLQELRRC